MKMTVFWDVAPRSLVKIGRRFGGAYCLHLQDLKHLFSWFIHLMKQKKMTYFDVGFLACNAAHYNNLEDHHQHQHSRENLLFYKTNPAYNPSKLRECAFLSVEQ
jgi:hypothetical protein